MTPRATRAPAARLAAAGTLLALGGGLAGCPVGPGYRPPDAALGPFHGASAVEARAAEGAAPPLDRWWTGFRDPELTRIVARAFAQNLDLQASLERVAQARAAARAAGARLLPALEANAQALAMHQSLESPIGAIASGLPGYGRNAALYDVGAGATWEIDLSGGLRREREAAIAEAAAAEALHLGVRVSVASEAADAYFQVRGQQARLQVAERQIATDERLLELVRIERAHGMATDREVAQAEALAAHARAGVPLLRIVLEAQMNRLDVLMGAQPGTYAAELDRPSDLPGVPPMSVDASGVLRRRPDVIAAERRLAAANARIGVAISGYYPKLSLSALLGFESMDAAHLFRQTTFQPTATGGLRWRLFDFGRVDAEVAQADAATREALARYRQSVLRAAEEVEDACAELVQLERHAQDVSQEVEALTRARDDSQEAFRAGLIPLTDVLDADRQLLAAQDELPRTKADAARAAVSLYRALGGGW